MISQQVLGGAIPSSCLHIDHSKTEYVRAACDLADSERSETVQSTSTVYSDFPTGVDTANRYPHLPRIFCTDDLHKTLTCPRSRISDADAKTAPAQNINFKTIHNIHHLKQLGAHRILLFT